MDIALTECLVDLSHRSDGVIDQSFPGSCRNIVHPFSLGISMTTRILVVDDSSIDRCLVGGLLEKGIIGVVVTYAANGTLALEEIASAMPDLIVSDLQMPEMPPKQ